MRRRLPRAMGVLEKERVVEGRVRAKERESGDEGVRDGLVVVVDVDVDVDEEEEEEEERRALGEGVGLGVVDVRRRVEKDAVREGAVGCLEVRGRFGVVDWARTVVKALYKVLSGLVLAGGMYG
jgi:hypothetical protein